MTDINSPTPLLYLSNEIDDVSALLEDILSDLSYNSHDCEHYLLKPDKINSAIDWILLSTCD